MMAFVVPTFNLNMDIFTPQLGTLAPPTVPRLSVLCNLTPGRRVVLAELEAATNQGFQGQGAMFALVPAGTDIRDAFCAQAAGDFVQVPAGSNRWYMVVWVDDVAKGFSNEYRLVALEKIGSQLSSNFHVGYQWPTPIP